MANGNKKGKKEKYRKVFTMLSAGIASTAVSFLLAWSYTLFVKERFADFEPLVFFPVLLIATALSVPMHIILHEGGHLAGGLVQGYSLLSFRIGSIALIKTDNGFKIGKFRIAGTGGQCLMAPPEPYTRNTSNRSGISVYLAGGVIMNLAITMLSVSTVCLTQSSLMAATATGFALSGIYMLALNAIPFRPGGIPNDIYNLVQARKNRFAKDSLLSQLTIAAMLYKGCGIEEIENAIPDLPDEKKPDYNDFYTINIILQRAAIEEDRENYSKAKEMLNRIRFRSKKLPAVLLYEIRCELATIAIAEGLRNGNFRQVSELLSGNTGKYAASTQRFMCDKRALLIAETFLVKREYGKAREMMARFEAEKDIYQYPGETEEQITFLKTKVFGYYLPAIRTEDKISHLMRSSATAPGPRPLTSVRQTVILPADRNASVPFPEKADVPLTDLEQSSRRADHPAVWPLDKKGQEEEQ